MTADDKVIAPITVHLVVVNARVNRILARATIDRVRVVSSKDRIVSVTAIDKVATIFRVRIAFTIEWVRIGRAGNRVNQERLVILVVRERIRTRIDIIIAVASMDTVRALNIGDGVVAAAAQDRVIVDTAFD